MERSRASLVGAAPRPAEHVEPIFLSCIARTSDARNIGHSVSAALVAIAAMTRTGGRTPRPALLDPGEP
jgi:hypothetical protein